jgi:predicted acetyltransferase
MTEIRELNEGDLAAWVRVGAQAYRRGDRGEGLPSWPAGDFTRYGLFERGEQVAQYHLWHYEIFFNAGREGRGDCSAVRGWPPSRRSRFCSEEGVRGRVPGTQGNPGCGGIASVACLPLARGKGYVEALLAHGLERMRERGERFSMLHAFLVGLYRPMGWEWVGSSRGYTLPLAHLPAGLEAANVRLAGPADAATLRGLYEAYAAGYRGMVVRPLSWWQERLESTTGFTPYFYLVEDPAPQGYLYLEMRDPARVRELIWQTPAAYRTLLGVLRRHKSQLSEVAWEAPPDDPLWHYAAHWDLKTSWKPSFSGRVVDLPGAFALLQPEEGLSGRCVIQVEDRLLSQNSGCWAVTVEGAQVRVERTAESAHVLGEIGVWSQLLFGDPDGRSLRRSGRLKVADERGFRLLCDLCPPALAWTNDYF